MKAYIDKRVVIEMSVEEAMAFWRSYHPKAGTVGQSLDAAVRGALDEVENAGA